jgi:hypothetical protein
MFATASPCAFEPAKICALLCLLVFLTSTHQPARRRIYNPTVKLAGRRWTKAWMRRMRRSRLWFVIKTTRAIRRLESSPDIFWVSTTAINSHDCLPEWVHYELPRKVGWRKPPATEPVRQSPRKSRKTRHMLQSQQQELEAQYAQFADDADHRYSFCPHVRVFCRYA